MDVFTWSIPFVAEKVIEMFYHIVKMEDDAEDGTDKDPMPDEVKNIIDGDDKLELKKPSKSSVLKNKIKFVSKLLMMQKL